MIARPLNRPQPIPFGAASTAPSSPRQPVSWAESSGPAVLAEGRQALHRPHQAPSTAGLAPILPRLSPVNTAAPARPQASQPGIVRTQDVSATFLGQGALSVRSSVTGRHYRFQGHGDRLLVDVRDQLMLARIADIRIG